MGRRWDFVKRGGRWVWDWLDYLQPPWLLDLLIATPISVGLGALTAIWWTAAFSQPPPKVAYVLTNDSGHARPMKNLLTPLEQEKKVSVSFDPSNLKEVIVCEFSRITGSSNEDVVLSYLAKYPMCFTVIGQSATSWVVRPKMASPEMKEVSGQWFCLCGM
jgi:hypothetical protein